VTGAFAAFKRGLQFESVRPAHVENVCVVFDWFGARYDTKEPVIPRRQRISNAAGTMTSRVAGAGDSSSSDGAKRCKPARFHVFG